jgi:hypothetical protein
MGRDRRRSRIADVAVLALSLAAGACDGGREETVEAAPAPQVPSVTPPRAPQSGSDEPALPERGAALVRLSPQGVTLLANEAPRLGVLRELEREARFRLEMAEGATLAGAITLRAVDASLDEVLARLLQGVPYAVHYGVEQETGDRVLRLVSVGQTQPPGGSETVATAPSSRPRSDERRAGAARRPGPIEDEREREERRAAAQAAFIGDLESPDPAIRADAAQFMMPDEQAIPLLSNLLATDPNPSVRAAAAKTLGDSRDSPDAVRALVRALRALRDPDPDVVVASLDALDWIGEATVAPELEFLLEDPVPRVREAAAETIESLAD